MSWITETLTATNKIKDPFVKFLVRLFLLLVTAFAFFIVFALVSGKKIIFNNGTYEIVSARTADSIAVVKAMAEYNQTKHKETSTSKIFVHDTVRKVVHDTVRITVHDTVNVRESKKKPKSTPKQVLKFQRVFQKD